MGISQLGGGRLITRPGASGGDLLPNSTGASGNTSTSDQTYGSWWQMTASTAQEYVINGVTVRVTSGGSTGHGPVILDIGIGGSGSEQRLDTVLIYGSEAAMNNSTSNIIGGTVMLPVGLRIPSGSRVAARAAMYVAGGNACTVVAIFHVSLYSSLE